MDNQLFFMFAESLVHHIHIIWVEDHDDDGYKLKMMKMTLNWILDCLIELGVLKLGFTWIGVFFKL